MENLKNWKIIGNALEIIHVKYDDPFLEGMLENIINIELKTDNFHEAIATKKNGTKTIVRFDMNFQKFTNFYIFSSEQKNEEIKIGWCINLGESLEKNFWKNEIPILKIKIKRNWQLSIAVSRENTAGHFLDENGEEQTNGIFHLKENDKKYLFLDGILEIEAPAKKFESTKNLNLKEVRIKRILEREAEIKELKVFNKRDKELLKKEIAKTKE